MKLFTVEEANDLLPFIRPKLEEIKARYQNNASFLDPVKLAAQAAAESGGGGLAGGANYVKSLYQIGKLTTELYELGVQLKDYSRGLIDFPSVRNGQVILLCWQLGEKERIEWWHETETGFAGRKPL
jgi:hypothetical protein